MCYMKKHYVSDYWNKGIKGHSNYDFVDVVVNDDNLLFIDPMLIETVGDEWCKEANVVVKSFFDAFYEAYKRNDEVKKRMLLSHAGELNGTHLGYGRGDNGKGNTAQGLLNIFTPLEKLIREISTMTKAVDLPILIPGFAEDGLSDLLTNVLHEQLNNFTFSQMKKYGIESNSLLAFWTWDTEESCWREVERPSYCVNGHELLAVPKCIVLKRYLFSTGQYFNKIIVERVREKGGYMNDGKLLPKNEVMKAKRYSGNHWLYNEAVSYTKKYNDALNEYHQKLPSFYAKKGCFMEDENLDKLIYGSSIL